LRNGDAKSDQINRFPCAFVIRPDKLETPFHIYPFDTGAGVSGYYGDTVDPYVNLEDYELEPNLAATQRHIAWAFGGNCQYFEGDLIPGLAQSLHEWQSVGRGWLAIAGLAATGSNRPDKRASAIEVAYAKNLPLKGYVRLVIFPQQLIEDDRGKNSELVEQLTKYGYLFAGSSAEVSTTGIGRCCSKRGYKPCSSRRFGDSPGWYYGYR
jgi:hypothetical protein